MKIAFVFTDLHRIGGASKFFRDAANGLCERGHDIVVIAQKINQEIFKFNDKICLIEVSGFVQANPLYWLCFNKIKKKYLKILNEVDAEIFFSHNFPTNYFCAILKKQAKFKHIYYCHEPFRFCYDRKYSFTNASFLLKFFSLYSRFFLKRHDLKGAKHADLILCNSKFTKKNVKKIYQKVGYVHYPLLNLSSENVTKNNRSFNIEEKFDLKNKISIFSLGLSNHMKGTKSLISIFKKVSLEIPEITLLIGGLMKKENEKLIKKLVKKYHIPKTNVKFCGYIEEDKLKYYYLNSNITFYTAIDEPFGLIPLESMNYGTPVIAFEGGPSETIIDGLTGYLIKNQDNNQFAQKALKLIKDKELYHKFSMNAKTHVKEMFNYERSISDLELIFQKVIFGKL
ncbi:hypothetical protein LCGC14_1087660 [marine sediment metagenome]|uniref:GDP-Man:Man(1)GlcNAc(2)-PP-Dol alpha-1,3-mannosyltransferase n=1 Tax=marine sediment metagenome TaxID=412755 RepID=A0A0F9N112_9ZZZZ